MADIKKFLFMGEEGFYQEQSSTDGLSLGKLILSGETSSLHTAKGSIARGAAVYFADTSNGTDEVSTGSCDTDLAAHVIGVSIGDIADGANGEVVSQGPAKGVLSGATQNAVYYLGSDGLPTPTLPSGKRIIVLGYAMNATDLWVEMKDYGKGVSGGGGGSGSGGSSLAIGSNISSSTPGSILFVDDNGQLGQSNANLFYDSSNHRVGVGTNSPSETLDIAGSAKITNVSSPTVISTGSANNKGLVVRGANVAVDSPYAPSALSALKLWEKASATHGISGLPVLSWADSSFNSDALSLHSGNGTLITNAINGKPIIHLIGNYQSSFMMTEGAKSFAFLFKLNGFPGSFFSLFQAGNYPSGKGTEFLISDPSTGYKTYTFRADFDATQMPSVGVDATLDLDTYHLFVLTSSDVPDTTWTLKYKLSIDGVLQTLQSSGNMAYGFNAGFSLGGRQDNSLLSPIDLAEFMAFNNELGDEDRQKVEGYLAWKYGLESKLPEDHPYKLSAPTMAIAAEQNASLQEWQKADGTTLTAINESGVLTVPAVYVATAVSGVGAGSAVRVQGSAAGITDSPGGNAYLQGGSGLGSGDGGSITVEAGASPGSGVGGSLVMRAGSAVDGSGRGGLASLEAGESGTGNGGQLLLAGGKGGSGGGDGGDVQISGGASKHAGSPGGAVTISGGFGYGYGNGGDTNISGGQSGTGNGGALMLRGGGAGPAGNAAGGPVYIMAPISSGTAAGGSISVFAGMGGQTDGTGGGVSILAGQGGGTRGVGGNVTLTAGGGAADGAGGDICITGGTGTNAGKATLSGGAGSIGSGGSVTVVGGSGGANTPGSNAYILGGDAQAAGQDGGSVFVRGGYGVGTGHVGEVSITGGSVSIGSHTGPVNVHGGSAPMGSEVVGSSVVITAGTGDGSKAGGEVVITGGSGGVGGDGGAAWVVGGDGEGSDSSGGAVYIKGGRPKGSKPSGAVHVNGSSVSIQGHNSLIIGSVGNSGVGQNGTLAFTGPSASPTANGDISLTGGSSQGGNNKGGDVTISGGSATGTGKDGSVLLSGGSVVLASDTVHIGNGASSSVGFFGAAGTSQQTVANLSVYNGSTGTSDTTIDAMAHTPLPVLDADAINGNFYQIGTKLNEILAVLRAHGLIS